MKDVILNSLTISDFGLQKNNLQKLSDRSVVVTKWEWDYKKSHLFQRACLNLLQVEPRLRVYICCNHPPVLTYGRGLQKARKGEVLELVDFDPQKATDLPYPFYQIERGGGLTFHHPGQFIFYPIVKLNPKSLSLSKMTNEIFDFSIQVLSSWGLSHLHHEHKLLGLWQGERKIASMGIAIEKLTTFHGMALNLLGDQTMLDTLDDIAPCGLSTKTYAAVDNFINLPQNFLEVFKQQFLKRIEDEWQ